MDVGPSQLDHASPATPPAGTRPEAMPPATAPMQNGTSTDEGGNRGPEVRWLRVGETGFAEGKVAPRRPIPEGGKVRGEEGRGVDGRDGFGNAVQRTTSVKINQTW